MGRANTFARSVSTARRVACAGFHLAEQLRVPFAIAHAGAPPTTPVRLSSAGERALRALLLPVCVPVGPHGCAQTRSPSSLSVCACARVRVSWHACMCLHLRPRACLHRQTRDSAGAGTILRQRASAVTLSTPIACACGWRPCFCPQRTRAFERCSACGRCCSPPRRRWRRARARTAVALPFRVRRRCCWA